MRPQPFLQCLYPESIAALRNHGVERSWPGGRRMFRAGDAFAGVHFLLRGLVKLYRSAASGREQIVWLEGKGSLLTITPALDRGVQPVSAQTLSQTTTLFVALDTFVGMLREREDMRAATDAEMSRRVRLTLGLLETIALKPVVGRVATRVLELAINNDVLDGKRRFRLLLSQDELGHVLATSRESVARALGELRAAGIIEQRGSYVRVVDAEALIAWSNVHEADPATTPIPGVLEVPLSS